MHTSNHSIARLTNVRHSYGKVQALAGIDFELRRGEVLALLGPNGAGKTTMVSLLLGLLRPDTGQATVFGRDPRELAVRRRIGAMLQISGIAPNLTVREQIDLFRSYYPAPAGVAQLVAAADLGELMDRRAKALSGGQLQRLHFALALAGNPELLFLDEPTTGLDVESRRRLWGRVRELSESGRTVLLTTHHLEEADALADRIVVIDRG
ncbi:MAG: ABC transporter ATP-binding protein, partial [Acidobacteriota bacterium]